MSLIKRVYLQENIKGIFVKMMTNIGEGLDFRNLVIKGSFNQITLVVMLFAIDG